jgi:hypothetical protein
MQVIVEAIFRRNKMFFLEIVLILTLHEMHRPYVYT